MYLGLIGSLTRSVKHTIPAEATHNRPVASPLKREQRNPMFVFVLDGALFRFNANAPSFVVLFQLPPRMKPRRFSTHTLFCPRASREADAKLHPAYEPHGERP